MKRVSLIFVLLLFANQGFSQLKFSTKRNLPIHRKNAIDSVLAYKPKPIFLAFNSQSNRYINLCSLEIPSTKTLFSKCDVLKEIDLNSLNYRTKWVFFKMKMWQYFR